MKESIDSSVRFWNRKAEAYSKSPISDMDAYQQKLARTREYLNPRASVLEFGCGTGSTALLHAPYVKDILAIDSSEKMIEIARAKVREEDVGNVSFERATLFELPSQPESFDVILGLNVLHLLDDMEAALQRCFQLLAPGGVFVSSTACIANAFFLLRWLLPIGGKLGVIPKVKIFTAETLEASIKRVGFTMVENAVLNKNGLTTFIIARK